MNLNCPVSKGIKILTQRDYIAFQDKFRLLERVLYFRTPKGIF